MGVHRNSHHVLLHTPSLFVREKYWEDSKSEKASLCGVDVEEGSVHDKKGIKLCLECPPLQNNIKTPLTAAAGQLK